MSALHAAACLVAWVWAFWALYVLVMGLYRAKLDGRLTRTLTLLGLPWIALGGLIDFVSQVTLATVVFLDPPRELLVTLRLQRYMKGPPGWRRTVANYVCERLLDPFDPSGEHC